MDVQMEGNHGWSVYSITLTLQYFKFDGKCFLLLWLGSALMLTLYSRGTRFDFQQTILNIPFLLVFTLNTVTVYSNMAIPVAARSKAWVCGRSLSGIVGSNPPGGMDVYLLWVLCVIR
jgi:hypothetical protein